MAIANGRRKTNSIISFTNALTLGREAKTDVVADRECILTKKHWVVANLQILAASQNQIHSANMAGDLVNYTN